MLARREGPQRSLLPVGQQGQDASSFWETEADVFIPAATSYTIDAARLDQLAASGVRVIACGANTPFDDRELGVCTTQQAADARFAIIPDFIANCGMARLFAYLMKEGAQDFLRLCPHSEYVNVTTIPASEIYSQAGIPAVCVGPVGAGHTMKLVNNMLAAVNLAAAGEACALAARAGLDLATVAQVVGASSGQSWIFDDRVRRRLAGDVTPRAHVSLLAKDSVLAQALARELDVDCALGALAAPARAHDQRLAPAQRLEHRQLKVA